MRRLQKRKAYKAIPVIKSISNEGIQENYLKIKEDIDNLFKTELKKIDSSKPKDEKNENKYDEPSGGNHTLSM